jgi:hypothetical protein
MEEGSAQQRWHRPGVRRRLNVFVGVVQAFQKLPAGPEPAGADAIRGAVSCAGREYSRATGLQQERVSPLGPMGRLRQRCAGPDESPGVPLDLLGVTGLAARDVGIVEVEITDQGRCRGLRGRAPCGPRRSALLGRADRSPERGRGRVARAPPDRADRPAIAQPRLSRTRARRASRAEMESASYVARATKAARCSAWVTCPALPGRSRPAAPPARPRGAPPRSKAAAHPARRPP